MGPFFMRHNSGKPLQVLHVLGTKNSEQGFGRYRANQSVVLVHNGNGNHVQAHRQNGDLFLIITGLNGLMFGLHDVADRAIQIGKELTDPDYPFQAAVVIRDEYRVRTLEPVAMQ